MRFGFFPDARSTVVHGYDDTLHVLGPFDRVTGPLAAQHQRETREIAEKAMRDFVQPARAVRPDLANAVEAGEADTVLKRHLEKSGCDLVVVGTHGRTGLRRALIGSVAELIMGTLPSDVLAVRQAA